LVNKQTSSGTIPFKNKEADLPQGQLPYY